MEIDPSTYKAGCGIDSIPKKNRHDLTLCPDGNTTISGYSFVADAMHYEEAYRREKPFDLKACDLAVNTHTTNNTVLTCIVEIGPSVLLINYEPHILTAQLKF